MNRSTTRLGELGEWGSGGTPLASRPEYYGGEIPWLIIEDLNDGVVERASRNITRLGLENSSARIVPAGTLLIAMYGSIGKLGITRMPCATNQAIAFCKCDPTKVDTRFLFYLLLRERERFVLAGRGGTQQNISQEFLKEFEIELPDLSKQHRIVSLLEQTDRLRRARRYALELSDAFLPAAFLEFFGDPATNPMKFPLERLDSVFPEQREGAKCGPFGSALKSNEYVPAGIPVWTMNNVGENQFREEGCLYITPGKFEELKAYEVRNDDVLISRAGTVGRMAVLRTKHERSIIHTNLIRLALDKSRCLPAFLTALMTSFGARVGRLKRGQEDAYTFMNTGRLAELRIPLPPFSLQGKFVSLAQRHEQLGGMQQEALRQAEHLFRSLLHSAFLGDRDHQIAETPTTPKPAKR